MATKLTSLLKIQTEILDELLTEMQEAGEIKSASEYIDTKNELLEKIKSTSRFLTVRPQSEMTDSETFNLSFYELHADLHAIFAELDMIDETINRHERLNQSLINELKLRIKKAENLISRFERLSEINTTDVVHLETFIDNSQFETEGNLYTDKNGQVIPMTYQIKWDVDEEALKLPTTHSENVLIGPGGIRLGHVRVRKQIGSELSRYRNPVHGLDKAIDTDNETFWSEHILTDAPIRIEMNEEYYNMTASAMIELEVHFDYITQLNELSFRTFSEFPFDLVGVSYYTTDNEDEEAIPLIFPTSSVEELKSRSLHGTMAIQFPDVYAKRMTLIFNQRHYIKTETIVSEKEERNLTLWFDATKKEEDWEIYPAVQKDVMDSERGKIQRKIRNMPLDVDKILELLDKDNKQVVMKYEYQYGLYNFSIRRNEYLSSGIYVSKPISINGNIKTFRLEADEHHPHIPAINDEPFFSRLKAVDDALELEYPDPEILVDEEDYEVPEPEVKLTYKTPDGKDRDIYFPDGEDSFRFTDIEYYVYDGTRWHDILPMNVKRIYAELLHPVLVNGEYQAKTRFPLIGGLVIRKNGQEITESIAVVSGENTLIFSEYDASAYYTAEYLPSSNAWILDFLDRYTENGEIVPNYKKEEFNGTDANGTVQLSQYPFVDKNKLHAQSFNYNPSYLTNEYLPIKIKMIDSNGYHIEQPINEHDATLRIDNKTDYNLTYTQALEPYDELSETYYQYQVNGSTIQFNTQIPTDTKIIVEYPYLVSEVRIKAIMRRNIPGFSGMTPLLKEFVGYFQRLL